MTTPSISDLAHTADIIVDQAAIKTAIDRIADRIAADYHGDSPVLLTVMQGALPFAGTLVLALGARQQDVLLDYIHATRYQGEMIGGKVAWLHKPHTALHGKRVLLVDDILDEGHTLHSIREWCLAQDAAEVRVAVLAVKEHKRCIPGIRADYHCITVPDRYVFGFGMDVNDRLRSLPAIYALR